MPPPVPLFPDPRAADREGLVAVTADLSADLLEAAYRQGIFPWTFDPVGWFSPDPRAVFPGGRVALPRNLGRLFRRAGVQITCDTAFASTMRACRAAHRAQGAWMGPGWVDAYAELHHRGLAHSVEVWRDQRLVGGIYGVRIGGMFAGESMFHLEPNTAKFALAVLAAQLAAIGVQVFDTQVPNDVTRRLGAVEVPRAAFLEDLARALAAPVPAGRWAPEPLAWGALSSTER